MNLIMWQNHKINLMQKKNSGKRERFQKKNLEIKRIS